MTASQALAQAAAGYWEGTLQRDPLTATFYGDFRFNDRLPDVGPAGREAEASAMRALLDELEGITTSNLAPDDRVSWHMLKLTAELRLEALPLRLDEMAVDQMSGPQVWLPELLNWHPTDTAEHVEQLIARYYAFPAFMDQYLANLREGQRDGRLATQMAADRVKGQLQALLSTPPAESTLAEPAKRHPHQAMGLVKALELSVYPAYRRMREFLDGYSGREQPGVWAVNNGEAIYALLCRQHTTTELSPAELHQVGLDELRGIQEEMRAILERIGAGSKTIPEFTRGLTSDPANLPSSREEIVSSAEELLEQARAALPRAFGRLPTIPCAVKPIEDYREKDSVAAFYYPPSQDGSRPGIFYVNTYEPSSRPKHTMPALTFHEAVPGHHLQIALANEMADLPAFRRLGNDVTAFVEGWALYTERLADELGLYPNDLARYGMLGYQAWRACRLVVDTGMHYLRWSRQQAIDFFLENVGLTERETVNEVDRYIIWPGQALSYKIGQREIESLRRDAQQRLGSRFDLRAFHDELLAHAAVPLSTLRGTMNGWMADSKPRA